MGMLCEAVVIEPMDELEVLRTCSAMALPFLIVRPIEAIKRVQKQTFIYRCKPTWEKKGLG